MPKSYTTWFILAGVWLFTAVLHIFEHASPLRIGYDILAALLFIFLGFSQRHYAPQGDVGKKRLHRITAVTVAVFFLLVIIALILF